MRPFVSQREDRGLPGWLSEGSAPDGVWVPELVENEDDVRVRFTDHPDRPRLRCGYCDRQCRPRSLDAGLLWFRDHACSVDYIEEQAAA